MYELDTVAGPVRAVTESLAEAMAECVAFEHQLRIADLYNAVVGSAGAAIHAPIVAVA